MAESMPAFVWTTEFADGFRRFARDTGKDVPDLLRELMRVLVETCYHWTATPTKGNTGARGGKKGGEATVRQDILWVFEGRSQAYLDMLFARFGSGPVVNQEFKRKDGTSYLIDNWYINPTGNESDMWRWHQSRRKGRGRTLTHAGDVDRDIGRHVAQDKMLVPNDALTKYMKDAQSRVGKLKGGWSRALRALDSPRLPHAWVRRAEGVSGASGVADGSYNEDLSQVDAAWMGSIEAVNQTGYFRDLDGFMERAHRYVETQVMGKRLDTWIDSMIRKHGSVRQSGAGA